MLAGDQARRFAIQQGLRPQNLMTPAAIEAYEKWRREPDTIEDYVHSVHDTVTMLGREDDGRLFAASSTSGWSFKAPGRVGDSPIIGAGLYVDNEVGAASATGLGEMVVRACGAHTIIEFMRQGLSPEMACKKTLERIIRLWPEHKGQQLGLLAIDNQGNIGGYGLRPGYKMTVTDDSGTRVVVPKHLFEWD